jgi:hypothetical protein
MVKSPSPIARVKIPLITTLSLTGRRCGPSPCERDDEAHER